MESYQHTVLFEADNLSDTELKNIQKYFQIRRRSGGGECDLLKVAANTYKICFKDKEAQERVLVRKIHIINSSGQENIRISLSCDDVAEQTEESEQKTSANTKPMEKVYHLDPYLLRYISESPKATSDLKQRLSKVSSSFQINIDSGELVVVKDQDAQDRLSSEEWNDSVEEVLRDIQNHFILHFEVDMDRQKILQENSFLLSENLRIYLEESLAVVVGESEKVDKIVKLVDSLQAKQEDQREYHISENQFTLVKEQFEHSKNCYFSKINICQDKPGSVILKGPEKEVDAAENELLNLVRGIKEKRIPLCKTILTFLESSGGIQHFQNQFQQSLRSPVLLEIEGSDLLLMSLTDGALTEASAALRLLWSVPESEKQPKSSNQQRSANAEPMEKVYHLDPYLLRYISESTNAFSDLKQRLSKVSSSFQINIDSGELVVVKDQDSRGRFSSEEWNDSVEEVLRDIQNHFILHFEVETHRLKILEENCFPFKENLRIYLERTLAVVVGESEQVDEIVKLVDILQAQQEDLREHQLSDNDFPLVKEQFEQIEMPCYVLESDKEPKSYNRQNYTSGDFKINNSVYKPDRRIILLGKTGGGKSSSGNTILGKTVFESHTGPESGTSKYNSQSGLVDGRQLTVIDTPGIFDTQFDEKTIKSEIIKALIECAPSLDALVIVLQLGRYTEHEEEIVAKIYQYLGEDTFKHAVLLFTHGEQLKGKNIEEFVKKSSKLQKLVDDCEGRCHVIDNEYWNNNESKDKNNDDRVRNLLDSIDKMVEQNGAFTSEFFLEAETDVQNEMMKLDSSLCPATKRDIAKKIVLERYLIQLAGVTTGSLLGAFLGIGVAIASVIALLRSYRKTTILKQTAVKVITSMAGPIAETAGRAFAGSGSGAAAGWGVAGGCVLGAAAVAGAVGGGITGYRESKEADSVQDAIVRTVKANVENAKTAVNNVEQISSKIE